MVAVGMGGVAVETVIGTATVLATPEARATATEIEGRPRHVRIAVQILAHRVAMGEAEDSGDVMRVDQVVEEHATGHRGKPTPESRQILHV